MLTASHLVSTGNQRLSISKNYVEKSLFAYGLHDLHFTAFVVHKLEDFFPLTHDFAFCKNSTKISAAYAEEFENLFDDQLKEVDYEKWYNDQVAKLLEGKFSLKDLKNRVLCGERNEYLEKLMVGLQGWNDEMSEEVVLLLNVFYDNVDWQLHSPFKPVIVQVGEEFEVNYLIDNKEQYRQNLILCLKAPCMDKHYRGEVFSWHHLKIK